MTTRFSSWLLLIAKICLWAVPFVPLLVSAVFFFPFIVGKAFLFRALVEIAFFSWIALAILDRQYRPRWNMVTIAILVFTGVTVLAAIFGVNPVRSFWSNFERMEGVVTYLHLAAYGIALASIFTKKDWNLFLNLFLVSGLFQNLYAFFQRLGIIESPQGGFRADGLIGNPAYLAAYLIFVFFVALLLLFETQNVRLRWYYGSAAVFTLLIIYFTASRGPAVGILVSFVITSAVYLFVSRSLSGGQKLYRRIAMIVLAICVLVAGGLWLGRNTSFIKDSPVLSRLTTLSFKDRTIASRFLIWDLTFKGFKERPLLGWGPENYVAVFSKYYDPALWRQEPWFDRAHSIIFDWLINAGIVGLLSYLALFATSIRLLLRAWKQRMVSIETTLIIITLFIAYFIQNLFVFDNIATYLSFFAILAYIIHRTQPATAVSALEPVSSSKAWIVGGAALAGAAAMITVVNIMPMLTNIDLLNAMKVWRGDNVDAAMVYYDKALAGGLIGRSEVREQFSRFAVGIAGSSSIDVAVKEKVFDQAITEAKHNVDENRLDPRAYLFLGGLYSQAGLYDETLAVYDQALTLSPMKQQLYFEKTDTYIKKGDFKKAEEVARQALELAPQYPEARINLVIVQIIMGHQADADQTLIDGYGTVNVANGLLAQTYAQMKKYDRLIEVWKAFIKQDEHNMEYHQGLAGAYLFNNQPKEAIQELETAIRIDPGFSAEANGYISEIKKQYGL